MNERYEPGNIESKWQKKWEDEGVFRQYEREKKFYALDMFPYPSGAGLHVGHPKGYIATDVISRMKQLQGHAVLHPMGWDAFGLPAEQYALKNKTHPKMTTEENVATFKRQLGSLGFTYDWDREINTTDPAYYKWTQWIFLKLLSAGLAYESHEPINWCPSCQTGLANEDLEDGVCERCGTPVEKKPMRQWVLRITDYADRLLSGLDDLDWPESIKESQRNWIGKSEGVTIEFGIKNKESGIKEEHISGVGALIRTVDGKYLFQKRDKETDRDPGMITPFGGGRNEGETASEALVRELQEELGITVDRSSVIGDFESRNTPGTYLRLFHVEGVDETVISQAEGEGLISSSLEDILVNSSVTEFTKDVIRKYQSLSIEVFTTRADTLFGCTYVVVAPEHPLIREQLTENSKQKSGIKNQAEVEVYLEETKKKSEIERTAEGREKTGVRLEGITAVNPINGEEIPVYVADYVLGDYGTGAVMAVPAHDERDFEFSKRFDLEFVQVIDPVSVDSITVSNIYPALLPRVLDGENLDDATKRWRFSQKKLITEDKRAFTGDGILINSGEFSGLSSAEARERIAEKLEAEGRGKRTITYKLRDWVFSRQRYWGEPIPVVHCETCGAVPVPESELPVLLPEVESYEPTGTGESPLADIDSWVNTTCPTCGGPAKRETNTMPQWAGSSWYYLRYIDPRNDEKLVDPEREKRWMPVDVYVGGAEHATRHLIYARFWHKFLYDQGIVSTDEPFRKLVHVGLILAEDGRKMSKRWGNVVNPDDIVSEFGADAMRLYEMFMGPFSQLIAWNTDGVVGTRRFLDKVWKLQTKLTTHNSQLTTENNSSHCERVFERGNLGVHESNLGVTSQSLATTKKAIDSAIHRAIAKVTDDIEHFRFNTAVSTLMELANTIGKDETISRETYEVFLQLLSPFAPHIAEELWERIGNTESIFLSEWPEADPALLVADTVTIVVQVNGKLRDSFEVPTDISQEELKAKALASEKVKPYLDGQEPKRVIVVPGRLVNVVV